ncbi:MAG: hypothetical protein LBM38_05420 [Clostridiales bacterium]|jgi:hypothetical protein|nr:hypothetical protein [Clostridiales bacterium]
MKKKTKILIAIASIIVIIAIILCYEKAIAPNVDIANAPASTDVSATPSPSPTADDTNSQTTYTINKTGENTLSITATNPKSSNAKTVTKNIEIVGAISDYGVQNIEPFGNFVWVTSPQEGSTATMLYTLNGDDVEYIGRYVDFAKANNYDVKIIDPYNMSISASYNGKTITQKFTHSKTELEFANAKVVNIPGGQAVISYEKGTQNQVFNLYAVDKSGKNIVIIGEIFGTPAGVVEYFTAQ